MSRPFFQLISRLLAICFVGFSALAWAADPAVRAVLSRGIASVGEPVQLQIKITGAQRVGEPPEVRVDGLQVSYQSFANNAVMRMQGGSFFSERTTTLVYQVVPEKTGSFTIPAVTVSVDGRAMQTQPVGLTVQPKGAESGGEDDEKTSFAEFVVLKKTAYLGETIPVELRLYVDARIRWQPIAMPEISGDGFTKQKMPEPQHEETDRNGKRYDVLIFKTAITPSRAGKITLGPSEVLFQARVPRARPRGQRSPFDVFGDDVFNDPFFSATQNLKAKADAIEMTVKTPPMEGRPASYSGAIGSFQFSAEGNPKQVKIGDPVTMKLAVTGRGSFDRMTAPILKDSAGWRTYPPSTSFTSGDELNLSGTKTFEVAVVPETKKTAMPVFQFSYFDPKTEKYVTLNSEAGPLVVEGSPVPVAPTPSSLASGNPTSTPPVPKADDILGLRYDRDAPRSFAPLYERRDFLAANGVAAAVLAGLVGLRKRRRPDAALLEANALRQEKAAAWAELQSGNLSAVAFYQAAARVAQLETALALGRPVAGIDAATVRGTAQLEAPTAEIIEEIFNSRAALLYAGGSPADMPMAATDRERVIAALKQLGRKS